MWSVILHCSFDLHFSSDLKCWASFHVSGLFLLGVAAEQLNLSLFQLCQHGELQAFLGLCPLWSPSCVSGALKYGPRRRNYSRFTEEETNSEGQTDFSRSSQWYNLFCLCLFVFIEILLIYNTVLVSGIQCKLIQLYTCVYTLFQILFHYRLLQNIEYSSMCYTVRPCCLSVLFIVECICHSQAPNLSLPLFSPLVTINLLSISVSLFLFYK